MNNLLPLDVAWPRLRELGIGHFAIDELIQRAAANRARLAGNVDPSAPAAGPAA